ncbi:MAG: hypothetical protein HYS06_09020 [Methylocystis sp.]|nr:hypothetical protein [Methylocystis sp.]
MKRIHASFGAVALAGVVASQLAFAKTPASPPAATSAPASSAPTSSEPSTATRVETWTKEQWNAAQKEWAKDKTKWAICRKQSKAQKLSRRKSWSFLYRCMTD